jgi:hypothetical protein
MNNLHTPERLPGETFAAYKKRREASREAARRVRRGVSVHHWPFYRPQVICRDRRAVKAAKRASSPRQYRNAVKAARRLAKESL